MTEDFDKERARSTFYKMIQVDRLHRSVFEKMHSAFGIHRSQHRLLMYISRRDTCPSQKEIAEHFGISGAAVAVSLKKLEDGGYIKRESLEKDSRVNKTELTEKGKRVVKQSEEFFEKSDFAMFENFSEDDYRFLSECLEKMMSGLKDFCDCPENFTSIE